MPELPEVETTKRGIQPFVIGKNICQVIIRERRLRWTISKTLANHLVNQQFESISRRGKYLLLSTRNGTVILHLGMSGSLRLDHIEKPATKHDHVDIVFANGHCLRFHDPRRFGCLLWTSTDPYKHKLLKSLGPEPLSEDFSGKYLYQQAKSRKVAIKSFLMNAHIVAGIGNIYANEALFMAGIYPRRSAGNIAKKRLDTLCEAIKHVLTQAIEQGGTTLRDFVNANGKPGYFQQTLNVYDRVGLRCTNCKSTIRTIKIGQRSTFYCNRCQR